MGQKKLGYALLVGSAGLAAVACGGGNSGAAGYTSLSALTGAIESPTGTVDETTATGVAAEFENSMANGSLGGVRQKSQAQSGSAACPGGGSASFNIAETHMFIRYNNCGDYGCVMTGTSNMFLTDTAEWGQCMSYDIDAVCEDQGAVSASFSGCINVATGTMTYLVEYDGMTYTVSGYYSAGTGELTISGENGTFTCTYTTESGTCTASTGESFTF